MIEICLAPAQAGVPGAQYALGIALVGRNEAGDYSTGVEWLEKSAAVENPAAAFALASVLLQQNAPASQERARNLLKTAVCAGYPYALSALKQGGGTPERVGCQPLPEENFDGEWIADLKWLKSGVVIPDATATYQLKIVLAGSTAQVFMKGDSGWTEVKPGRFRLESTSRRHP
jgi:hypothetical protein